jgi:hypothetical protein
MPGAAAKKKQLLLFYVSRQDKQQQSRVTGGEIHYAPLYQAKYPGTLPQGETKNPGTQQTTFILLLYAERRWSRVAKVRQTS